MKGNCNPQANANNHANQLNNNNNSAYWSSRGVSNPAAVTPPVKPVPSAAPALVAGGGALQPSAGQHGSGSGRR